METAVIIGVLVFTGLQTLVYEIMLRRLERRIDQLQHSDRDYELPFNVRQLRPVQHHSR